MFFLEFVARNGKPQTSLSTGWWRTQDKAKLYHFPHILWQRTQIDIVLFRVQRVVTPLRPHRPPPLHHKNYESRFRSEGGYFRIGKVGCTHGKVGCTHYRCITKSGRDLRGQVSRGSLPRASLQNKELSDPKFCRMIVGQCPAAKYFPGPFVLLLNFEK